MAEPMTVRALNRALLARQMLLAREKCDAVSAVERLAGMQAQEAKHPFIGLWTRVRGFRREALARALHERSVVRVTAMRATLHLMSADDYLALRGPLQPAMDSAMVALRGRDQGLDVPKVGTAALTLLRAEPRDFEELRGLLAEQFPGVNERALGYATRLHVPLAMVPSDDAWAFPRVAKFTPAEDWLGAPPAGDDSIEGVVMSYLAAFGPATAADVQTWSGLRGVAPVLKGMRERLVSLRAADGGRELFDLPDAPRPGEDADAPVRFVPEFDNLVLAHKDRARILPEESRGKVVTKNLRVRATFLVDGFVAGTWTIERKKAAATLVLEPFGTLTKQVRGELEAEGDDLLRFAEPDADDRAVRIAS